MRLLPSASLTLTLLVAAPAYAQDRSSSGGDDVHTGEPIIVTAPYVRSLDILGNVSVLEGDELARDLRGQIGDSLTRQPGVSATSFAPGASRPVLRGFSGERVRVLTDGIGSIDVSNTSADHAVTVDPLTVERVEILRGPAVLLFGSQAIGGAVNLFDRRIPRKVPADHVHFDALGGFATVANDGNVGASVDVALTPQIVAHLDGSWRKTGDTRSGGFVLAPGLRGELLDLADEEAEEGHAEEAAELTEQANARGKIANTASETWTAAGGLSLINDGGQLGVSISYYDSNYGVPSRPGTEHHHDDDGGNDDGDEHGEEAVTIGLKQWRADLRGEVELGDGLFDKLRVRAGFADYEHTEFEGDEVGTVFTNQGVEGRLELAQNDRGGWRGASGVQYSHRDFNAVGAEAFVPRNLTDQFAVFTLQELTSGPLGLEGAARFETTSVRAPTLGVERRFNAFSGALGATYDIAEGAKIGASVARAVRAPSAEELFSNGPHIATQAFEVGDPDLKREASWGVEASVKYRSDAFNVALTGYANWFDDFIYSAATGEEEDELPVFQYFQNDARVWGFEAEASARLAQFGGFNIVGDVTADMTRAKIRGGIDQHVPRIPPLRVLGGLEAQGERIDARVEVEWTDDQTRIAEFETPTKGFTLVNASVSWRPLPAAKNLTLTLAANNIFDVEARRHASFTKDYVPLAGRDFRLTARASF